MDRLPLELLTIILQHLPSSSHKKALRLTCRAFNFAIPSSDFTLLASFYDPAVAVKTIEAAASDLLRRPRSIWSPRCSVPDVLFIPDSFLSLITIGLARRRQLHGDEGLAPENLEKLNASLVRQAMFRWVLYLSYTCEREADVVHMWVINPKHYR